MAVHQSVFANAPIDSSSSSAGICRPDRGISSARSRPRWRYFVLQGTRAVWVGWDLCDLHRVCSVDHPPPRLGGVVMGAEVGNDWEGLERK